MQAIINRFNNALADPEEPAEYMDTLDIDRVSNLDQMRDFVDSVTCSICLGVVRAPPMECKECAKPFCKACIEQWQKNNRSCPYRCANAYYISMHRSIKNILFKVVFYCKFYQ